jgi:DNA-binding transcriptional LysR family regulator
VFDLKLRQVQFVVEIARTRSIRAAASICNATQPTLSTALAQLEEELGGKLFERTTRVINLTSFGQHMLPLFLALLEAQTEIQFEAKSFNNPKRKIFRIGMSPLVDICKVNMVTEPYLSQNEGLEVFYKECLLGDVIARLKTGAIDIAILPSDIIPLGMSKQQFYRDRLFYISHTKHDPEIEHPLYINTLPSTPLIMTGGGCGLNATIDSLIKLEATDMATYSGHALSYHVIQEWVQLGIGAGILPEAKLTDATVSANQLMLNDGNPAYLQLYWVWLNNHSNIEHLTPFLDHLRVVNNKPF